MKEGLDAEGYIAAECAAEKIPALFRPVLDECLDLLAASFAERIHGVYLYGSVATGKAVAGQSDLDVLIVWAGAVSREDQAEIKRLAHGLTLAHRPLLREVGLEVVALDEVFAPANLHGIGCFIKHLCLCVAGADVRPALPKFRPGAEVSRGFNGDYEQVLQASLVRMEGAGDAQAARLLMRQICRKTLRTGFSLVMPRLGCWTTDLQASCDCFSRLYPDRRNDMRQILEWTRQPPETDVFRASIGSFGAWLAAEFDCAIPANPQPSEA